MGDNMKNTIKYILIAILLGIIIGKYVFNEYKIDQEDSKVMKDYYVYLMQYGVYANKGNMIEICKNIKNYFYFKDSDGYHVIIGITKNKENKKKIVDSLGLTENIYMKREKIDNNEFMQLIEQYDNLINQTEDKEIITNAQKQILSNYEELIIQFEK